MVKRRNSTSTDVSSKLRPICEYFRSDKQKLESLNRRLLSYIERIRCVENDRSDDEMKNAHNWSEIKMMYERELARVRKALDETAFDKTKLEIQNARLIEENEYYRQTLQLQCNQSDYLCDLQTKYNLLCFNYETSLNNANELRNEIDQLHRQLDGLHKAFESEKLTRIYGENGVKRAELPWYDQINANELQITSNGDKSRADIENELWALGAENDKLKFIIIDAEAQLRSKTYRICELENNLQELRDSKKNFNMVPFEEKLAIPDKNAHFRVDISTKSMVVHEYYHSNRRVSIASSRKHKHMKDGRSRFAQSLQRFKIILKLLEIGKINDTRVFIELRKMKKIYFQT